jgi:hypothetical protein
MNIEGIITLFCGIYCTLLAFRVVAPGKNPERNELWYRKFGTLMKFCGPFLILVGLLQVFKILD